MDEQCYPALGTVSHAWYRMLDYCGDNEYNLRPVGEVESNQPRESSAPAILRTRTGGSCRLMLGATACRDRSQGQRSLHGHAGFLGLNSEGAKAKHEGVTESVPETPEQQGKRAEVINA
jgi:hypothetical protein